MKKMPSRWLPAVCGGLAGAAFAAALIIFIGKGESRAGRDTFGPPESVEVADRDGDFAYQIPGGYARMPEEWRLRFVGRMDFLEILRRSRAEVAADRESRFDDPGLLAFMREGQDARDLKDLASLRGDLAKLRLAEMGVEAPSARVLAAIDEAIAAADGQSAAIRAAAAPAKD